MSDEEAWQKAREEIQEQMWRALKMPSQDYLEKLPRRSNNDFFDWYIKQPLRISPDWCWIDFDKYRFPFLISNVGYVPQIPGWEARKIPSGFVCDCGDRECTGGLVAND